jgi:2-methylaconitate cis-trans-isomerase PrpF/tripartite-type tricarboxylate transporter receptor subunit TctC
VVDVAAPSTTICPTEPAARPPAPAGTHPAAARPADSQTAAVPSAGVAADRIVPCVLMRAGTSRGPFFLREWLPADDIARDEALIGAIGATDLLQVDGVGGGSTLTSKVAIVSKSREPGCDVDYLFAQVGVGQRSVDTRPNCGNMLAGVAPFALEQGLVPAGDETTTVRVFNVNTRSRIDVTVQTPGRRVTYAGEARIDGVAGTAAPIRLDFLDAWGATTGSVFPTGARIDVIDGVEVTCIDAAMPLMIVRAVDLGVSGTETPAQLDADPALLRRLEALRRAAGRLMGLGDVSASVIPKPVLVSAGDGDSSVTSRYFTPHRCHASHAVTGAVGLATAFALPGTVAHRGRMGAGVHPVAVLHPQGRIDVEVEIAGEGDDVTVRRAALLRTARKILEGDLHLPGHVFSEAPRRPAAPDSAPMPEFPSQPLTLIVPTPAGGANDAIARTVAARLGPLLGRAVVPDNRTGAHGSIAAEYVARAVPDGHTLLLGYTATHGINPALHRLAYDPVTDFAPVGLIGHSPTVVVAGPGLAAGGGVEELVAQLAAAPGRYAYASAGEGTAPQLAAELFKLSTGVDLPAVTYPGSSPAVSDTVTRPTQLMFSSLFTAYPWITAGRLRALAVAGPDRVALLPGVPTLHEAGVEGVDVTQWYALFAPAGTPAPVIARINAALTRILTDPDTAGQLAAQGISVRPGPPRLLGDLTVTERARWTDVIDRIGRRPAPAR